MEGNCLFRLFECLLLYVTVFNLAGASCPLKVNPVARMCYNSSVSGKYVYIDTTGAQATENSTGPLCECTIKLHNTKLVMLNVIGANDICGSVLNFKIESNGTILKTNENCTHIYKETIFVSKYDSMNMTLHKTNPPFLADYCTRVSIKQCSADQYQCNDGACISEDVKCDDLPDCATGDDEDENTCAKHTTQSSFVTITEPTIEVVCYETTYFTSTTTTTATTPTTTPTKANTTQTTTTTTTTITQPPPTTTTPTITTTTPTTTTTMPQTTTTTPTTTPTTTTTMPQTTTTTPTKPPTTTQTTTTTPTTTTTTPTTTPTTTTTTTQTTISTPTTKPTTTPTTTTTTKTARPTIITSPTTTPTTSTTLEIRTQITTTTDPASIASTRLQVVTTQSNKDQVSPNSNQTEQQKGNNKDNIETEISLLQKPWFIAVIVVGLVALLATSVVLAVVIRRKTKKKKSHDVHNDLWISQTDNNEMEPLK